VKIRVIRGKELTTWQSNHANYQRAMLASITAFGLLPRDALHVAVMERLGLSEIATDDADFDRAPWLRRHWVFNAPAS
jgi:predicted nucleic acid-binding protein